MTPHKRQVSFAVSTEDDALIACIVERAIALYAQDGADVQGDRAQIALELRMDLTAAHANGCPLDLQGMLDGRDLDLVHDVGGIRRHLNRRTGRLVGHFLPRHTAKRLAGRGAR